MFICGQFAPEWKFNPRIRGAVMPEFKAIVDIPQQEVEVSFEVFCSCGAGLCGQSEGRQSRQRNEPQVVVEPCKDCLQAARAEVIEDFNEQIKDLQDEIAELEKEPMK